MLFDPTKLTGAHAEKVAELIRFDPLFQKLPTQLFTFDNGKTPKGEKQGYLTAIMYLAPSDLSGYPMCPFAKLAQCEKPCLNTAGRGKFDNVQKARIRKTLMFQQHRGKFDALLIKEMHRAQRKADKMGLTLVVRLNGTSDIPWEIEPLLFVKVPLPPSSDYEYELQGLTIFECFSNVQFYDYTKYPTRHKLPANYHLTFSYSGARTFTPITNKWHSKRTTQNIAVVFESKHNRDFLPWYVHIDGDESDLRFLDPINSVVSLTPKGNAKNDTTGFVVRPGA